MLGSATSAVLLSSRLKNNLSFSPDLQFLKATKRLVIHPEVEYALKNNDPVVALESTIITHGMPWPANLETAKEVEQVVKRFIIFCF